MTIEVDYHCTSRRPSFEDLPQGVRRLLADAAGCALSTAHPPVTSGFTGAFAALLDLADGRRVFAKAAGPSAPHAKVAIPREASVLRILDGRITAPVLVGAGAADEWEAIVLEAIDGRLPGVPWTSPDVELAHDACLALAAFPTDEVTGLTATSLAVDIGMDVDALATLDDLAAGRRGWPRGIRPLPADVMVRVAALAHRAGELLTGQSLVHCDLRPDNLLVTSDGVARIVDWNWVTRGPAWADFVSLWPLMARDGIDVHGLATRSPLTRDADPDAVDAFLAVIAGYMLTHCEHPTFNTTLGVVRDHQRLMAQVFLDLLVARRGWTC
ncbi:phosphotransferase [Pedococcus sp. KACC 23699]|uniref:Phosphotransferase n=1 Tax=Pedococcus sp. KACC 23699 TaxID=3149228 RepID=A0AAU7JUZ8_9MICO